MTTPRFVSLLGGLLVAWVGSSALADPPGRVGRISLVTGEVLFQNTHTGESEPAQINWPVTGENVIATGADGRVEVRIGSTSIRLDNESEVEFARLDDENIRIRLLAGHMALRVKNRDKLSEVEVRTPHGRAVLDEVGHYRFDTRGERDSTGVSVYQGAMRFDAVDRSVTITSGRRTEFWGSAGSLDSRQMDVFRDEFDDWNFARDRRDDGSRSTRYVSQEMTGYDELDEHGEWRDMADHGVLWVPHASSVPQNWAPYRWGRWVWVDPWGWTWIDAAPWGFAPFHYGRWVHVRGTWGWTPGAMTIRPVYAPALVGWMGHPGAVITISSGPAVGWFPLAPREVFYPAYPCSAGYVRRMNVTHVHNVAAIQHTATPSAPRRYQHAAMPHAVTMVPAAMVSGGRQVTPAVAMARDHSTIRAFPIGDAPTMHAPPRPESRRTFARPAVRPAEPASIVQPGFHGGQRAVIEPARPETHRVMPGSGAPQPQMRSVPNSIGLGHPNPGMTIRQNGPPQRIDPPQRIRGVQRHDGPTQPPTRIEPRQEPQRVTAPSAIQPPMQIRQPRIEPLRSTPPAPAMNQQSGPGQAGGRNDGPGQRRGHQGQPGQHRSGDGR